MEGASLNSQEQDQLLELLMEYADIFALGKNQLGRTDFLQHRIHTGDAAPILQQFRRMYPQRKQALQ